MFNELVVQWGALAGFAALIAATINVLKSLGVVKDGQAAAWSAGLNLLGLGLFLFLRVYYPDIDIAGLDQRAEETAEALLIVFGYFVQLGGAKLAHIVLSGLPVVGKRYSEQ